jgi:hypothetical protein
MPLVMQKRCELWAQSIGACRQAMVTNKEVFSSRSSNSKRLQAFRPVRTKVG